MRNINVIGGSGFIGTRLMHRLRINDSNESKIIDKGIFRFGYDE